MRWIAFSLSFVFACNLGGNEEESQAFLRQMSPTKRKELEEAKMFLEGTPAEPPEEILNWLKSKKIFEEPPIEEFKGEGEQPPIELTLFEAIAATLQNQWEIDISESVIKQRCGEWQKSAGPFDPIFQSSLKNEWLIDPQQIGFKTDKNGSITSLAFGLQKLNRIGTSFNLNTTIQRVNDPSLLAVSPGFSRYNQSTLAFEVDQPLLRRFIYNQESVEEIVASLEFEAAQYDSVFVMSEQVLNTVLAYWEVVFAEKVVSINEDAKRILEGLASASSRLIEKSTLAASELNEQIAELARNRRDLIASQQDVYNRYNALLLQMGERRCSFSGCLPHLFLDNFILPKGEYDCWNLDCLLNEAYIHRGDLLAARVRIWQANILHRLARNNLLPDLDVILGVEFLNNTVNQGSRDFFSSFGLNDAEKDISAELRFSFPLCNDRARGEKRQRYEEQIQAFLEENELWSTIYSDIATALRNHIELVKELEYANKAAEWYEIALRDEILRTKAGYSSLFFVIDFENRFRLTLLERANVQRLYAQNLARLLFLTGTLVLIDTETQTIHIDPFHYQHLLVNHE